MSKILMYSGATTGVTTSGSEYAFFISEAGLPTIKQGSTVISFGTSGYAFAGSSGSSGTAGQTGSNGTNGISGTSGQDGASGAVGPGGTSGSSGLSGTAGINGVDGASGTSGTSSLAIKASSVALTAFSGDPLSYDVIFTSNFPSTNYSVNTYATGPEAQNFSGFYPFVINKTVSGFTINTGLTPPLDPNLDTVIIDWTAIIHTQ